MFKLFLKPTHRTYGLHHLIDFYLVSIWLSVMYSHDVSRVLTVQKHSPKVYSTQNLHLLKS